MAKLELPITITVDMDTAEFAAQILSMWLNSDEMHSVTVEQLLDGRRRVVVKEYAF